MKDNPGSYMMAHTYNPCTRQAEELLQDQPGLNSEILSQTSNPQIRLLWQCPSLHARGGARKIGDSHSSSRYLSSNPAWDSKDPGDTNEVREEGKRKEERAEWSSPHEMMPAQDILQRPSYPLACPVWDIQPNSGVPTLSTEKIR